MNVLLLDAFNLLFRSFTTLPRSIAAPDSTPVNGVYGMLNSILTLRRELSPDAIVAAFDVPEIPTFRQQRYPPYQAQRGPLGGEHAESFRWQTDLARRLLPTLGIPALTAPGYEADDIMGTLARQIAAAHGQATIVSTDRDLTQLVRPEVSLLIPGKVPVVVHSDDDVRTLLGVPAACVTTFKALAGDASDNIPGVRGIGRKGAADLVNRYRTLEGILGAEAELPPRIARAIQAGRNDALLFRDLVTIVTDLDLGIQVSALPETRLTEDSRARHMLEEFEYGRAN